MSNPLINSTRVVIPVDVAIAKTSQWRKFMQGACPDTHPSLLPKGVYISRDDIMYLAQYLEADDTLLGVRTYFTLESDLEVKPEPNDVKFVMVLVQDSPDHINGKDLLRIPEGKGMKELSPDGGSDDDSNVYDFTNPCPDCCDPTSELYDVQPPSYFKRKVK